MKWNTEKDNELTKLVGEGKKHVDIAMIMNTSTRSITNRCARLGLYLVHTKEFECQQCNKFFIDYIRSDRKFCSSSCAAAHTNLNRIVSDETKFKIRKSLLDRCSKKEKVRRVPEKIIRKCKFCLEYKIDRKKKCICDDCREKYYKAYRPSCEFSFDINLYRSEFDYSLVEKYGWYSPSNRGNNLNGVSKDHMYSVRDGFINGVDYNLIKHPANCRLMKHTKNSSKHSNSEITLQELKERVLLWNQTHT